LLLPVLLLLLLVLVLLFAHCCSGGEPSDNLMVLTVSVDPCDWVEMLDWGKLSVV
jgi:hypothetical protein